MAERQSPLDSLVGGLNVYHSGAAEGEIILSRSAKRVPPFHLLLSHARYEHRPRLLFSYSHKRGMQSLRSRDMVVRGEDKHVGTKPVRMF